MSDNIKTIYTFTILTDKLVDKPTERIENEGTHEEKLIVETTKVNQPVPTYFAFKKPSRSEREQAEEERAVWWSRYVEKGILPESILLKTYANAGGILSKEQKAEYTSDRVTFAAKTQDLMVAKAIKETPPEDIAKLTAELIDLRDKIIQFEQDQSTFFENTAEAKARVKVTEHLVISLSYTRSSESEPWVRYFKDADSVDRLEEAGDKIFSEAYPQLLFLSSFLVSSNFAATKEDIDEFLNRRNG